MAKGKEETKDLTVKAEAGLPMVLDFAQDAGAGVNTFSAEDVSIPFITILQQLSPQLKRGSKVEGAEEGFIFNPVTLECIDGEEGIVVVPCAYHKRWVEWKPRSIGGGFVRHYDTDDILKQCTIVDNKETMPNGNIIVPTAYYYVIIIKAEGVYEKAVIPMASTLITVSKKWNSIMSAIKLNGAKGPYTPPIFAHKYRMKTIQKTKNNFSWHSWDISMEGVMTNAQLYLEAKKLNEQVTKGDLKVTPPSESNQEAFKETTSEVM